MGSHPYISLHGQCEAALEFYRKKLGAKVLSLERFGEAPVDQQGPPDRAKKIMHTKFQIGSSEIMASDGCYKNISFCLRLILNNLPAGEKLFHDLSKGGEVLFPWQKTFWAEGFGMLTDKFGISWMVDVPFSRQIFLD